MDNPQQLNQPSQQRQQDLFQELLALHHLLPLPDQFSAQEAQELHSALSHPTVLRFFKVLANNAVRDVVMGEFEAFDADELVQSWMLHHVQIVGEAVRALSIPFREANPQVPWKQIIGMRHILVHDYFGIDLEEVWAAVEHDLPDLKRKVKLYTLDELFR